MNGAARIVQAQREVLVRLLPRIVQDMVDVAAQIRFGQFADVLLGEGLLPAHQGQARDEATKIPAEVPHVRLVEIVDVEDEGAFRVHVRAEVLQVQIAVDPHSAGALVGPRIVEVTQIVVEQAGAAPVEGERIGGHLPELRAKRTRVRLHQIGEGLDEDLHDPTLPRGIGDVHTSLLLAVHGVPHACSRPHCTTVAFPRAQRLQIRPRIGHDRIEVRVSRSPAQFGLHTCAGRDEDRRITGAPRGVPGGDGSARHAFAGRDHLPHTEPGAGAEVVDAVRCRPGDSSARICASARSWMWM